jgi:hypothetical protein
MLLGLFKFDSSEFWAGTVNGILQFILRHVPGELAPAAHQIADGLLALFPYAAGRALSKLVKPVDGKPAA